MNSVYNTMVNNRAKIFWTFRQLIRATGLPFSVVRMQLNELVDAGFVVKVKRGGGKYLYALRSRYCEWVDANEKLR